jgi:serine-type D-Ala-D-Ala carboxypeptidase (penicillin-binding protein 5/6)
VEVSGSDTESVRAAAEPRAEQAAATAPGPPPTPPLSARADGGTLTGARGEGSRPTRREIRQRASKARRPWFRRPAIVFPVIGVIVLALVAGAAAARLSRPAGHAVVHGHVTGSIVVPGSQPAFAWPSQGEAAIYVPRTGWRVQSAAEKPVPVASLTKLMTAYVVLHDHPLVPGQSGSVLTMSTGDVAFYEQDVVEDQSSVQVQAGEQLSELQLLQGLLVHSAGNFGDTLAVWDAGSEAAFIAKMNAAAAAMGMKSTHYADVTGYDPGSVSTAADQLRVASADMAMPVFASIVDHTSVTLPLAGTVPSYTPLVTAAGVVGVKSGFTDAAGGCDVLATYQRVGPAGPGAARGGTGARRVLVLTAVTGQEMANVLPVTGFEALLLAESAARALRPVSPLTSSQPAVVASFGGTRVAGVAARGVRLIAAPGQRVTLWLSQVRRPPAGSKAGTPVARESVRLGRQQRSVVVRLSRALPGETLVERLF